MKPAAPNADDRLVPSRRVTRVELLLIAALFLVGAALRCAYPSRMAVEHFDEGVYASNYWFGPSDGFHYPGQHLYAPPLLPWLIDWVFTLFGPSNFGAMVPSLVAGCLTVPLVWWVGRAWFGPAAGLAAATLAALSDPHIAFSRTALTDVLLCFWLLLGVYFIWLALTTRRTWPTIAAGLFTGLAWWTKYNGWLPLAIGGAGGAAWWLTAHWGPGTGRHWGSGTGDQGPETAEQISGSSSTPLVPGPRSLVPLLTIAVIAFAAWSPWLFALQDHGGYGVVAANHRGYLVGVAGWRNSLIRQCENLSALQGLPTAHAPIAALVVVVIWSIHGSRRFTWNRLAGSFDTWLAAGLLLLVPAALRGWIVECFASSVGLGASLVVVRRIDDRAMRERVSLAAWLLAAWFIGLTVATPAYSPYPRLMLPWIVSGWFAGGLAFYLLVTFLGQVADDQQSSAVAIVSRALFRRGSTVPRGALLFGAFALCVVAIYELETTVSRQANGVPGWQDRSAIRGAARALLEECDRHLTASSRADERFAIYTLSEPALMFQLRLSGAENVRPVSSLGLASPEAPLPRLASFVCVGAQARRTAGFAAQFAESRLRLQFIGKVDLNSSPLTDLDNAGVEGDFEPFSVNVRTNPPRSIEIYELR